MNDLLTSRLRLLPLTQRHLQLGLRQPQLLEADLGLSIKPDLTYDVVHQALQAKVQKMSGAPRALHHWFTYWLMVLQDQPVGIGLLGFKGAPDSGGEVEIGYGIAPEFERSGYTTEAVQQLVHWALAQPDCRAIRAVTLRNNRPSQRVLQKVGMSLVQENGDNLLWRIKQDSERIPTGDSDCRS